MSNVRPWLIVGLGNPGKQYVNTFHNVGRAVVELIAASSGARFKRHRGQAQVARISLPTQQGNIPVLLGYAKTFMNIQGPALAGIADYEKIPPENVLVVHDELDLPAHDLRLKTGGGSGGHNGLKSVTDALRTPDYRRLRIGIGRPPGRMDPARYVLSTIPTKDREQWDVTYQIAADWALEVAELGFTKAQMSLHTKDAR